MKTLHDGGVDGTRVWAMGEGTRFCAKPNDVNAPRYNFTLAVQKLVVAGGVLKVSNARVTAVGYGLDSAPFSHLRWEVAIRAALDVDAALLSGITANADVEAGTFTDSPTVEPPPPLTRPFQASQKQPMSDCIHHVCVPLSSAS